MVVELCDMMRKDGGSRRNGQGQSNMWNGLPNFKKFKKVCRQLGVDSFENADCGLARHQKNMVRKGAKVELELPPPIDYGMGDGKV